MHFTPVIPHRFQLGEGPHYDAATGLLTLADIVRGEAWEVNPATGATRHWAFGEPVAAIAPRKGGGYVVAKKNTLALLDPATGQPQDWIAGDPDPVNRSNETRVDPVGRLWLGSMQNNIGPKGEDLAITQSSGSLFRIEPDGRKVRVLTDIGIANTLCWDPARGRMYFGDTIKNTIWAFDWNGETGEIGNRRIHFGPHERGHADGSAIDAEGYLWNARWGGACIIRIAPDGAIDRVIETPAAHTTSCVFGGPDLKTLYVTSARQGRAAPQDLDGVLFSAPAFVPGQACTRFAG